MRCSNAEICFHLCSISSALLYSIAALLPLPFYSPYIYLLEWAFISSIFFFELWCDALMMNYYPSCLSCPRCSLFSLPSTLDLPLALLGSLSLARWYTLPAGSDSVLRQRRAKLYFGSLEMLTSSLSILVDMMSSLVLSLRSALALLIIFVLGLLFSIDFMKYSEMFMRLLVSDCCCWPLPPTDSDRSSF